MTVSEPLPGVSTGELPGSPPKLLVRIYLTGHPEDLFTLGLLFPRGRLPNLHVETLVRGQRSGIMYQVTDDTSCETVLGGPGCSALVSAPRSEQARWTALTILAPLNGFATLADSNFEPVDVERATIEGDGRWGVLDLRPSSTRRPGRLIAADRVQAQRDAMPARIRFMTEDPLAAYAAAVIAGPPSWTDYYRVLEDIAGRYGTRIDRLHETGLASRRQQRAFTSAANNRLSGRHGQSGITFEGDQRQLMTLLEAREFVRRVVAGWLDEVCGGHMPRDRVDGPALRFGLDETA